MDGTGPSGQGPFTGKGDGMCVEKVENIQLPEAEFFIGRRCGAGFRENRRGCRARLRRRQRIFGSF
ncbi:MAG: DUF5320 family protein [Coriobacteriia bacterium]